MSVAVCVGLSDTAVFDLVLGQKTFQNWFFVHNTVGVPVAKSNLLWSIHVSIYFVVSGAINPITATTTTTAFVATTAIAATTNTTTSNNSTTAATFTLVTAATATTKTTATAAATFADSIAARFAGALTARQNRCAVGLSWPFGALLDLG